MTVSGDAVPVHQKKSRRAAVVWSIYAITLLAVGAWWVYSYGISLEVYVPSGGGSLTSINSAMGRLGIAHWSTWPERPPLRFRTTNCRGFGTDPAFNYNALKGPVYWYNLPGASNHEWDWGIFRGGYGKEAVALTEKGLVDWDSSVLEILHSKPQRSSALTEYWGLGMPVWVIIAALSLPVVVKAVRMLGLRIRRWFRNRAGRCWGCGYDLRASVERCPECGTPISLQIPVREQNKTVARGLGPRGVTSSPESHG